MPHLLAQLRVRALCAVGVPCSTQVGLRLVLSDISSASTSTVLPFALSPVPDLPWASPVSISTAAAPLRAFGIFHFCFCNNSFTEI